MFVLSFLLIVAQPCRQTGGFTTSSFEISSGVNEKSLRTRALSTPPSLSNRQGGDVAASGSECVLFVRSYWFDRIFTRPTIILDMPLTLSASSRNHDTPNDIRSSLYYNSIILSNFKREPDIPSVPLRKTASGTALEPCSNHRDPLAVTFCRRNISGRRSVRDTDVETRRHRSEACTVPVQTFRRRPVNRFFRFRIISLISGRLEWYCPLLQVVQVSVNLQAH